MFSEQELAFLRTQPLARLATVAVTGQPDADAIGASFINAMCNVFVSGNLPYGRKTCTWRLLDKL